MSLEKNMKTGKLYQEYGHTSDEDKVYEKIIEKQRYVCKDQVFLYNHTLPSEQEKRTSILKDLLGSVGEHCFFEGPIHFAYGCNTHIGNYVYANFNFSVVDDIEVHIGNHVMFGPNVVISVTGHPLYYEYRKDGGQFSYPVYIEDHVWIGAGVIILPGVTIGKNSVIGAGSVVTKDIPENSLALGTPCKVIREISDHDKEYYYKDQKINFDW